MVCSSWRGCCPGRHQLVEFHDLSLRWWSLEEPKHGWVASGALPQLERAIQVGGAPHIFDAMCSKKNMVGLLFQSQLDRIDLPSPQITNAALVLQFLTNLMNFKTIQEGKSRFEIDSI